MAKAKKLNVQENSSTELKLSFQDKVIETLVAFANTSGGTVYIGVADDGTVAGINLSKESLQNWLNEIKSKTEPSIVPRLEEHRWGDKTYVTIQVQEFPIKPLSFKGRYYKRVNNSNHQLSPTEIADLNLQTLQVSWDAYPDLTHGEEDIDWEKVKGFVDKVNAKGRFQLIGNPKDDLRKLKLISEKGVSNAAVLLFGKGETIYNLHIGRFKSPSRIVDDRIFKFTLFELVEETMKYLISQIKFAYEITGETTQRTEIPEYPLDALRELVLNAVVHRDYLSPGDVQIKIFDDRITFYNPGRLANRLTVEDLQTDSYPAYARNKMIAEAFYLTGDIEKYGSGFLRIREAIGEYPTMKLKCEEIGNGFMISLSYTKQKMSLNDGVVDDGLNDGLNEGLSEGLNEGLNEGLKVLLELIQRKAGVQGKDLSEELGRPVKTIERQIAELRKRGLIERRGSRKTGGYYVCREEP